MRYIIDNNSTKLQKIMELYLNKVSQEFSIIKNVIINYDKTDSCYNIEFFIDKKLAIELGRHFTSVRSKTLSAINRDFSSLFGNNICTKWYAYINE